MAKKIIRTWSDVPLILTTTQTADILCLTTNVVRKMLRNSELPGIKVSPKKWIVEKTTLMDFLGVTPCDTMTAHLQKGQN